MNASPNTDSIAPPTHVDTLIHARWVIPMHGTEQEPADTVLHHHCVVVHEGDIIDVLDSQQASDLYTSNEIHELHDHALIPGLINSHTHAAMSLMRGIADDMPLMQWLEEHIWPVEGRWVDAEFVRDGTRLAIAEMIRSGTTCFNDMYFFPDTVAWEAKEAGIRAAIGLIVLDFPTVWARDADEYLNRGLEVHDTFRGDPLLHSVFAPHGPYTVSDAPLERIRVLSDELDLPIHMHIHETADEINNAMKANGVRPLQRLDRLGLLSPSLMAVHMTQLTDGEIERLAETGAHVIHCAESNMKLASGSCPVDQLQAAGINCALGTDGAASNNDLDMIGEMRSAALLGKLLANNASALPAHRVLEMATLGGAKALGIDKLTGSIQRGKSADLCAINLNELETSPCYDPISQIVYSADRRQVTDVWCAGKPLMHQRQLTTLDEREILERARHWQQKLKS